MDDNKKYEACRNVLKELVRRAKKQHISETSTTGGVAGFETPHAFVGNNKKLKSKMKKVSQMFGYRLVYPSYWHTVNDADNDGDGGDGGDGGGD